MLEVRWKGELTGGLFGRLELLVGNGKWQGVDVWVEGAREPARIGPSDSSVVGADGELLIVPSGGFAQANPAMIMASVAAA